MASPCTGLCRLDPHTARCDGCHRTLDEIAAWGTLTDVARRAVLAALPARLASKSIVTPDRRRGLPAA